jgi:hypothetical protein
MIFKMPITLFILFFFSGVSNASSRGIVAVIDSLDGKAEIQESGQQKWRQASLGAKLKANDIIRALDKSFLRISWPDGNVSFVRANSQILINFFESKEPDILSTHITVFYGAVFFVIKEILPAAFSKYYNMKVYTPTAVVSIRGTAFAVDVNPENGRTVIAVINGTVLARNIIKEISSFISAGFKTSIEMKTDPIVPTVLLDKELSELKTWVPFWIIDREVSEQLAKAKRDHQILAGDFKDKFVVMPFTNRSKYNGKWNISLGISRHVAEQLKQSNKNALLPQKDTAASDPIQAGQNENAQYVIIGDIENFDVSQHAEITPAADEYKEFYIANVRLHIQLINVAEKKMEFDNIFTGETRGKNLKDNSWQKIGKLTFNLKDPQFINSLIGSSTQQAIDQAIEKIVQWSNYK